MKNFRLSRLSLGSATDYLHAFHAGPFCRHGEYHTDVSTAPDKPVGVVVIEPPRRLDETISLAEVHLLHLILQVARVGGVSI